MIVTKLLFRALVFPIVLVGIILLPACTTPATSDEVRPTPPERSITGLDLAVDGKQISLQQLEKKLFPMGTEVTIRRQEGYQQSEALKLTRELFNLGYKVQFEDIH